MVPVYRLMALGLVADGAVDYMLDVDAWTLLISAGLFVCAAVYLELYNIRVCLVYARNGWKVRVMPVLLFGLYCIVGSIGLAVLMRVPGMPQSHQTDMRAYGCAILIGAAAGLLDWFLIPRTRRSRTARNGPITLDVAS